MWSFGKPAVCVMALALYWASTSPGLANFRVCNKTGKSVDVAFAYESSREGWISQGWWVIEAGRCTNVWVGNLTNRYYYVYARDDKDNEWVGDDNQDGGAFCMTDAKFSISQRRFTKNNVVDCEPRDNYETKTFIEVDVENYRSMTYDLLPAKEATAPPPKATPKPAPTPAPSPSAPTGRPSGDSAPSTACQRFPNLC